MKKYFLFFLILLSTIQLFSFKQKHSKTTLDELAYLDKYLRVTETFENFRNITENFATYNGTLKFLQENGSKWYILIDKRRGVPTLIDGGAIPFIPGAANNLQFEEFGASCNSIQCIPKEKVEEIARNFLIKYPDLFPVKQEEIEADPDGTIAIGESIYLLRFQWYYYGIPVEKGSIFFRINNGNLIQIASENIAPIDLDPNPYFSKRDAFKVLQSYLGKAALTEDDQMLKDGVLYIIPVTKEGYNPEVYSGSIGDMASFKLVYRFIFKKKGTMGTWEALIDAHSGQLLRFVDVNRYGKIQGGVYKTDMNPTRVEVTMPFPYADYGSGLFSDIGGNFSGTSGTSTMTGRTGSPGNVGSVVINDNCGEISLSSDANGLIDFGSSSGTDCTTPGFGGAGNTHSSRTQYWNVAQIKIKAYTYLTGNTWLQGLLTDNVNINSTCNAYWNGTSINFFRKSSSPCRNTGELPGVSLHEWGHGMDDFDGSGGDSPPVETRADWSAILQTHESCAGGGFFESWDFGCGSNPSGYNCDGYGDCCTSCSGIRDADWAKHASNTPWTAQNNQTCGGSVWSSCGGGSYNGPCGWEDHCESGLSTQALWDLATRDLPTYCGMDTVSAWQLVDRLFYSSMPSLSNMYTCSSCTTSGCTGNTLYNLFRAVDDDGDGTANGTPHAQGIYYALARHNIACGAAGDPENQNQTSCPSLATPTLSGVAGSNSAILNWNSITNATRYFVFRNDTSCDSGFTKIATVNAPTTTYTDSTASNGITSYYRIQAATGNDSCVSSMSNCVAVTPQPCAGAVSLSKTIYNCADSGTITVLDSTAPSSPFNVEIWSTTDGTHRTVQMTGSPSTYTGTFTTTTGTPGANQVKVSNGDTIYVRYVDPDYCGTPNVNVETTASVDCVGPVITNVQVSVSGITATITWDTNELSNSKVYYGKTPPTWTESFNASMVTSHSIVLTGLDTCTKYYFWVESTDLASNTGYNDNGGSYYTFVTGLILNLLNENFEGTWGPYGDNPPSGWTIEDYGSSPGTWNENDWYKYAKGGTYVNVARVYYSPVENQDEWLITPAFDISSELTSLTLEFDHYFYEFSEEWAYVDYKSNQNPTWTTLITYDGTTANMAHETISLNSYIGHTNAQIRFRYVGNNGWYWEVDNVKIIGSGVCATSAGTITLDKNIYICNNDTITITIRDTDLTGTAQATITTTGGDQETVICYETGLGVFTGTINTGNLPRTVGDGILQVSNGETITGTYYDADDGSGNPQTVQDTAITDCIGPVISNVQVINITGTTATITWTTNENSNSRVTYGTSIPPGINQEDLINFVTSHSINLAGLSICTPYYFSVSSCDIYGNCTTDNNSGSYYTFTTLNNQISVFSENFNSITPPDLPSGWTRSKTSGNDWVTDSSGCTGNALMYPYNSAQAADSWAYTPGILLTAGTTYTLSFNQKVYSSSYPEKMEVKCGLSNTPAGQTITIMPEQTWTNTTCTLRSYQFTVPATGTYYIGFHCTSAANMWNLYIDDINLTRPGSCIPELVYQSKVVTDACNGTGSGGGNGILEPGEDATIQITIENLGGPATGVSATLSTSTPGITILDNSATFPNIGGGGTGTSNPPHFTISVDPSVTCVTVANFTLHTTSNENPSGNDSYFTINIGQAAGAQVVFSENFSSITPPTLPSGWSIYKTSGNDWQSTNSYYCNAAGGMYYPYNYSQAADSWAFTPGITLQAGVTYTLNFNQKVQSASYPEIFEVKCGTSATPAGQTITILPSNTYTNTTCTLRNPTFTVPTTGTYYISFHCTSAANMYYLIIDDIQLTSPTPPICNVCTPSTPNIMYSGIGTITEITGDGDSFYEIGEKFSIQVTLTNNGTANATNVYATLSGNGIEVCNPSMSFGNIPISGTGSATFEFVINKDFAPCGGEIGFDIINKICNEKNPAGPNEQDVFEINVGQSSGGNTVTLFGPDDLTNTNNWTLSNYKAATTSTCHSAADAQSNLNGTSYMTQTIPVSTIGYTRITVYYDWRVTNPNATQYLDWSTNGTDWNNGVASINTTTWLCNQFTVLPSGAEEQSTLYIRFRTVSNNATRRGEVDYIRITGDVTLTWDCSYVGSGSCATVPKPVPDGITGVALKASKTSSDGTTLVLDWDNQCDTNANILYGSLSSISSYTLSGSICNITDNYSWNLGATTDIWFVLVSDNGSGIESSWGNSSTGQRNGTTPSNQCGNTQRNNTGTCP